VDRICASLYAWRASVRHNGTTRVKAGQDKLYFIDPDSGAEIDFVGDLVGTPIESKYVSQGWRAETDALQAHHGHGIVATRDILDLRDHIWAMPAALLAWMINDA